MHLLRHTLYKIFDIKNISLILQKNKNMYNITIFLNIKTVKIVQHGRMRIGINY